MAFKFQSALISNASAVFDVVGRQATQTDGATLTFSESVDVAAEVVGALLAVHQLAQSSHQTIAFLETVVGLVRQIHLDAALHAFRNTVRQKSFCNGKFESESSSRLAIKILTALISLLEN